MVSTCLHFIRILRKLTLSHFLLKSLFYETHNQLCQHAYGHLKNFLISNTNGILMHVFKVNHYVVYIIGHSGH